MALTSDKQNEDGSGKTTPVQDKDNGTKIGNEKTEENYKQNKQIRAQSSTAKPTKENDLSNVTSFEDILEIVGTRGRWNLTIFLLVNCICFVDALQTLSYQFLGATPDHWCHIEPLLQAGWTQDQILNFAIPMEERDGATVGILNMQDIIPSKEGKRERCFMYDYNYTMVAELGYERANASSQDTPALVPCYSRDFNHSQYQSTMTTEWDLVCERRGLYATTNAAAQLGKLIGYFFLGYLADTFGRRPLVLICGAACIVTSFSCALSSSVELNIFLRVAINVATSGMLLAASVILMETSAIKDRAGVSILKGLGWASGFMIIPGIAYFIRTWKWLQAALSLPSLLLIALYWLIPESPRWLVMHGRHEEAMKVLKVAATTNGRTLPSEPSLLTTLQLLHAKADGQQVSANNEVGEKAEATKCERVWGRVMCVLRKYLTILIVKEMRPRALILFFCWFSASLVYYGIALSATNISVNVYLYTFLGGALEIPCYILLCPFTGYLGRVKALVTLYLTCGVFILILALFIVFYPDAPNGLLMFFSLTGKIAITADFAIIWLFTPELFPTKYRSLATGQASVAARVGSITSPYINDLLGELVVWAPSALFCIFSLLAAILASFLPETKGRGMPEGCTVENKADSKGTVNEAYAPETSVISRNSGAGRLNTDNDQMGVTDTQL